MAIKCSTCGKKVNFLKAEYFTVNGKELYYCEECANKIKEERKKKNEEEEKKRLEEIIAKAPKINTIKIVFSL